MLIIEPMENVLATQRQYRALQSEIRHKNALLIRKRLFIAALNKGLRMQRSMGGERESGNKRGQNDEESQVRISKTN